MAWRGEAGHGRARQGTAGFIGALSFGSSATWRSELHRPRRASGGGTGVRPRRGTGRTTSCWTYTHDVRGLVPARSRRPAGRECIGRSSLDASAVLVVRRFVTLRSPEGSAQMIGVGNFPLAVLSGVRDCLSRPAQYVAPPASDLLRGWRIWIFRLGGLWPRGKSSPHCTQRLPVLHLPGVLLVRSALLRVVCGRGRDPTLSVSRRPWSRPALPRPRPGRTGGR